MRRFWFFTALVVAQLAITAWLAGVHAALDMAVWGSLTAAVLLAWLAAIAWYVERKTTRRRKRPPPGT